MLGMTRGLPWLQRDFRFHPHHLAGGLPVPAFILGLAFGFGWTPCIGPILGAILTLSATQTTVSGGVGLLATYAAGPGVPFLLTAVFTRELARRLKTLRTAWHRVADSGWPAPRRHGRRHHDRAGIEIRFLAIADFSGVRAHRVKTDMASSLTRRNSYSHEGSAMLRSLCVGLLLWLLGAPALSKDLSLSDVDRATPVAAMQLQSDCNGAKSLRDCKLTCTDCGAHAAPAAVPFVVQPFGESPSIPAPRFTSEVHPRDGAPPKRFAA